MSWAWVIGLLAGLVTGVISGFGIGGGSLLILYLTTFAGMDQYTAGGLNLLYFLFCAPAALISHIKNKLVDWKTVLFCTVTGVVTSVGAAFAAAAIDVSLPAPPVRCAVAVYWGQGIVLQIPEKGKRGGEEELGDLNRPKQLTRR